MIRKAVFSLLVFMTLACASAAFASAEENQKARGRLGPEMGREATFISSDSLSLNTINRIFTYQGNVRVTQGDLTLESDLLDGRYSENNEIESLEATGNVVITRGIEIEARSNRALYDNANQVVILSENPELRQNGGTLTADVIRIFLDEDRSVAEGEVRMRLEGQDQQPRARRGATETAAAEQLPLEPASPGELPAVESGSPLALP